MVIVNNYEVKEIHLKEINAMQICSHVQVLFMVKCFIEKIKKWHVINNF